MNMTAADYIVLAVIFALAVAALVRCLRRGGCSCGCSGGSGCSGCANGKNKRCESCKKSKNKKSVGANKQNK